VKKVAISEQHGIPICERFPCEERRHDGMRDGFYAALLHVWFEAEKASLN